MDAWFCHAKMSVADDRLATCGTINLDYRSLYHHFENGCFMTDVPAVLSIKEDFDETFRQCREVTEKYSVMERASSLESDDHAFVCAIVIVMKRFFPSFRSAGKIFLI